jgi:hypothetical protein
MRKLPRILPPVAFALVFTALQAAPALAGMCNVLPFFCDDDPARRLTPATPQGVPAAPAVTPEIDAGALGAALR